MTTSSISDFFYARPKLKYYLPQALTVFLIVFIFGYFSYNAQVNMDNRGIDFGLRFLGEESSFDIQFTPFVDYDGTKSYATAYLVGLINTIIVALIGIFFATIIGIVVGISRLSPNYLIAKMSEIYVEIFRNVPLLLQLFFWYFAALRALPLPKDAIGFFDVAFLSIKGFYVPRFIWTNGSFIVGSIIVSIIIIFFLLRFFKKEQEQTGKQYPKFIITLTIIIILPLLTFLIGGVSLDFEYPELKQLSQTIYNFKGGIAIIPELMALAMALSLYTATFIAECVRAGIQGISKGQKDAAASMGLTPRSSSSISHSASSFKNNHTANNKPIFKLNEEFIPRGCDCLSRYRFSICRNGLNADR